MTATMKVYRAELSGIITRDIIWREVDAVDEAQAKAMFAEFLPGYRLRSIIVLDGVQTDGYSRNEPTSQVSSPSLRSLANE